MKLLSVCEATVELVWSARVVLESGTRRTSRYTCRNALAVTFNVNPTYTSTVSEVNRAMRLGRNVMVPRWAQSRAVGRI
ncbi:hypothetical protein J2776_002889 [Paraburkholderia caledonica]|uniref:Uncharacterized protein n=1 Tax=Paraburkholderia caledonica TaxID=134536 RepID=A0ABU1KZ08_9BURK|nr:hypothetical protein [Paraburkholderia caledonica]